MMDWAYVKSFRQVEVERQCSKCTFFSLFSLFSLQLIGAMSSSVGFDIRFTTFWFELWYGFIVIQFGHGQSNPTFLIEVISGSSVNRYVLRKKPPGKLLASAHAVEREFQVCYVDLCIYVQQIGITDICVRVYMFVSTSHSHYQYSRVKSNTTWFWWLVDVYII